MGNTSTAVKQKYLNKAYAQIAVRVPKELAAKWEKQLQTDGIGKAEFFRKAMEQYLEQAGE